MSTKRQATEPAGDGMAACVRKKYKPDVNLPSNVASRQPARASLLGLPAELRNHIYALVFGHQLIHIALRNAKCSANVCQPKEETWQQVYERSKLPFEACESTFALHTFWHANCTPAERPNNGSRSPTPLTWYTDSAPVQDRWDLLAHLRAVQKIPHPKPPLHLDILLTCRQIYAEAFLLPFATNTFQFEEPIALRRFAATLNPKQVSAITSIQTGQWSAKILCRDAKLLSGLKCLQYYTVDCECSGMSCSLCVRDGLGSWCGPKLERVEVIMAPRDFDDPGTAGMTHSRASAAKVEEVLKACLSNDQSLRSTMWDELSAHDWKKFCFEDSDEYWFV